MIVNKVSSLGQYEKIVNIMGKTIDNFLGGHLHRLGEISKGDVDVDLFDRVFLSGRKGKVHENIVKILRRFTEELKGSADIWDTEQKFRVHVSDFHTKKGI